MRRVLRALIVPMLMAVCLTSGLVSGVAVDRRWLLQTAPPDTIPSGAADQFSLMAQAWNTIERNYVDRSVLQPTRLTYGALSGMVDSLGDTGHSRFLPPDVLKEESNAIQGQFEGIGAEVQTKGGQVVIVAPLDGSPAQQAGLRPGDIILKVDGKDVAGLSLSAVVDLILGPAGSKVTLTILDPNTGQTRDVSLVRARIVIHNVSWERIPGTTFAHVRITAFSEGVTDDAKKALAAIEQQGLSGIILDLRNDPGGLLDESIKTTSQFLSSGNVVLERNAQGKVTPVPVQPGGTATGIPMVVIVNAGTASAAEILAGALQDAGRAKIVGETTFGTGTVLDQFKLNDGSALLLATEEWLTPKGRTIWHQGITPDVSVTLAPGHTLLSPDAERTMTPEQFSASGDDQLLEALKLLGQETSQKP
jgi:carboxyl-terminal processing protease